MTEQNILVEHQGLVATVVLNHPPHNFFTEAMLGQLSATMQALDASPSCRSMVLTSRGRSFCAGADFGGDIRVEEIPNVAQRLYDQAKVLLTLKKPWVAAVQGAAIGGGLGLALAADFRVASPKTKFSANFAQLGMHCGFAISVTLPYVVGRQAASQLLLTGRRIDGATAHAMGLVDDLVESEEVLDTAQALAKELANAAPNAVQAMKATLRYALQAAIPPALEHELGLQREHVATKDFLEGIRASAQRRAPVFTGT